MKIKNLAVTAAALAALTPTACGGNSPATAPSAPAPASSSAAATPGQAEHNQADIAFAQGMIPHHQQAVEMSKLATDRAGDDRVRRLATQIQTAQAPEIAQLRGFLTSWGAPQTGDMSGMSGMDHGNMSGMSGMMTHEQMTQLEQAKGGAFDRMFLQMMIKHHEGAVQMAQTELAHGSSPQAKELAQKIIDAQQAEITEMRTILG